ncbi:MAG: MFS transporter [Geobacter sp.]|nr:MAG: MFS transporter [Geobacter sp.]
MSENAGHKPLEGARLALATFALSLATFMNVLDTTITNVCIPTISGDLGVSPSQGMWVITSFAVSNAIAVPLTGWLTQRIGQLRLFLWSVSLFILASLLCGCSVNLTMLVTFRVIQGLVAGPMIPLSMALLLQCFPKQKAGMAVAMWSMTTTVAPITGPILGGWLTDNVSWPWIFYINIPVGIVAAVLTGVMLKGRESQTRKLPIDKVGLSLLVVWVGALQILLDKGKELDWFNSPTIVILAVVALVTFSFFLVWELTEQQPIVDLTLFARRNFTTATVSLSLGYSVFFMNIVLTPLWLQQIMGYTATWAGLVTAPVGILAIVLSPLVGRGLATLDPRLFATGAFLVFAAIFFMRSGFSTGVDFSSVAATHLIQGIGLSGFMTSLTAIAISGLAPERIPAASGLLNFTRIMLGAFGASIGTTMWENRAAMHHARLAEQITPYSNISGLVLDKLAGIGLPKVQGLGLIETELNRQAFMLSGTEIFYLSGLLCLLLSALIWAARPVKATLAAKDTAGGH